MVAVDIFGDTDSHALLTWSRHLLSSCIPCGFTLTFRAGQPGNEPGYETYTILPKVFAHLPLHAYELK